MPTTGSDTQPMSTPYHNLAHKPRIRLERRFAITALERFGFPLTPLRLLTLSHSARFRVVAEQSYLLRLQSPTWHPFAVLASELTWLMTLRQRTALHVPEPLRAPDGQVLVELTLPDTTQTRYASIFPWIAGRQKYQRLTHTDSFRIGVVLGVLHHAAQHFTPPPDFVRYAYHTDIFTHLPAVLEIHAPNFLTPASIAHCQAAVHYIQAYLATLARDTASYGLIHADTNLSNFLHHPAYVAILDFEVCCFGYYLYDVARTVNELLRRDTSGGLANSFAAGYRTIQVLPAIDAEPIRVFRVVNLLETVRWLITTPPAYAVPDVTERLDTTIADMSTLVRT